MDSCVRYCEVARGWVFEVVGCFCVDVIVVIIQRVIFLRS